MRRQVAHEGEQCLQKCGRGGMTNLCACNGNGQQRSETTIFLTCPRGQHKRNVLDMPFVPTGHVNACSVLSGKIAKDTRYSHTCIDTNTYTHGLACVSTCVFTLMAFPGALNTFIMQVPVGHMWLELHLPCGSDLCAPKYSSESMFNAAYY